MIHEFFPVYSRHYSNLKSSAHNPESENLYLMSTESDKPKNCCYFLEEKEYVDRFLWNKGQFRGTLLENPKKVTWPNKVLQWSQKKDIAIKFRIVFHCSFPKGRISLLPTFFPSTWMF